MNTIGLIGLGVMGQNFALNIADQDFAVGVYNRTYSKTQDFITNQSHKNISGYEHMEELVASLEKPRNIILLVKAGTATEATIDSLIPLLEKGDSIIDMGNAHYNTTISQIAKLEPYGITFIGCGISGGEEGARHGPALMPGGGKDSVDRLLPILEKVSARDFDDGACVTNVGLSASGNYVKMVHNGIEYAIMQAIAEVYDIYRNAGYTNPEIHEICKNLNTGLTKSFLLDITEDIFITPDDKDAGYLLDKILDTAKAKGTGGWTAQSAIELGVPTPSITASVITRQMSARNQPFPVHNHGTRDMSSKKKINFEAMQNTLTLTYLGSYLQGLHLIDEANKEYNWNIDISEVIRIWQGGCIIRSEMLRVLPAFFVESDNEAYEDIQASIPTWLEDTGDICNDSRLPLPVLRSIFDYFTSIYIDKLPSNLTQAQRDVFGAHTYQRNDMEGVFHSEWGL